MGGLLAVIGTIVLCTARKPEILIWARILQGFSGGAVYSAGLPLIADSVKPSEVGSWFVASELIDESNFLVLDLFLRLIIIEKGTAALWDEPEAPPIPHPAEVSVPKTPEPLWKHHTILTKDIFADHEHLQEPFGSDSEDGSSIFRVSLDTQSDASSYSASTTESLRPQSWFPRRFQSTAVILGSRRLMTAVFGVFVYIFICSSFDGILTQFVKRTFNFNSFGAGIMFLAISTPALFGTVYGALSDRYGPRNLALIGFIVAALGLALIVLITHDSGAQKAGLSIILVIIGIGVELILTPVSADMFYEADNLEESHPNTFGEAGPYAQVYSLLCVALGLATAVGPAWSGFMYEVTSWSFTMLPLVVMCLVGSVPVYLYTGGRQERAIALPHDDSA
ncbi:MAG: hypothetical protein Q9195_005610 [Heterodermia aff. obscurata]